MYLPFFIVLLLKNISVSWCVTPETQVSTDVNTSASLTVQTKPKSVEGEDGNNFKNSKHSKAAQKLPMGRKKDQKFRIHEKNESNDKKSLKEQKTPKAVSYVEPYAKELLNTSSMNDYLKGLPSNPLG